MRAFFRSVAGWHRWFNVSGDGRASARAITGWSNVIFLFLVLSGLYLWFPRRRRWQHFKPILLFNPKAKGLARDFNWHHVFGFWVALPPLALVVASATVISFPWASDLAYRVMGDTPPLRTPRAPRPPPDPAAATPTGAASVPGTPAPSSAAAPVDEDLAPFDVGSLDRLVGSAIRRLEQWRTIAFSVPEEERAAVQVRIDLGWGGEPQKRHTVTYKAATGREIGYSTFHQQSPGRRLRTYLRFAHTGEYHGLWGQTIAGLASPAGVFLVWSGIALAWRRLG